MAPLTKTALIATLNLNDERIQVSAGIVPKQVGGPSSIGSLTTIAVSFMEQRSPRTTMVTSAFSSERRSFALMPETHFTVPSKAIHTNSNIAVANRAGDRSYLISVRIQDA